MSITNIISNETATLVQGVNGICLCEESWVTSRRKSLSEKKNRQDTPTKTGGGQESFQSNNKPEEVEFP